MELHHDQNWLNFNQQNKTLNWFCIKSLKSTNYLKRCHIHLNVVSEMPLHRWLCLQISLPPSAASICLMVNVMFSNGWEHYKAILFSFLKDEIYFHTMATAYSAKGTYLYVSSNTLLISVLKYRSIPNLSRLSTKHKRAYKSRGYTVGTGEINRRKPIQIRGWNLNTQHATEECGGRSIPAFPNFSKRDRR